MCRSAHQLCCSEKVWEWLDPCPEQLGVASTRAEVDTRPPESLVHGTQKCPWVAWMNLWASADDSRSNTSILCKLGLGENIDLVRLLCAPDRIRIDMKELPHARIGLLVLRLSSMRRLQLLPRSLMRSWPPDAFIENFGIWRIHRCPLSTNQNGTQAHSTHRQTRVSGFTSLSPPGGSSST